MPKYYVLQGGPESLEFFENSQNFSDEEWYWTVPKKAEIGDLGLVYLTAPISRIVGQVEIVQNPFLNLGNVFDNPKMNGKYCAQVEFKKYFQFREDLTISGLRNLFPEWSWLFMPRGNTRVPETLLKPILELITKN